ncbi:MAG: hypothetical protein LCI00_23915 [Chloroflexi bacterium]|nr:hypothetical protein [Chloroflexota bacterium]MCC6896104.1 hypothetical protein [Anaerolineae bacterium]
MTTTNITRPRYPHVYTRYHRVRRVLTAAIAAAAAIAATAVAGKIISGV